MSSFFLKPRPANRSRPLGGKRKKPLLSSTSKSHQQVRGKKAKKSGGLAASASLASVARDSVAANEEIVSDEIGTDEEGGGERRDSDIEETAEEKKLRLTKIYLSELSKEVGKDSGADSADDEDSRLHDKVGKILHKKLLEERGLLRIKCAQSIDSVNPDPIVLKGHKQAVTCLAISRCNQYLYSGGKDASIIKWHLMSANKLWLIKAKRKQSPSNYVGHRHAVLALALSSDSQFLVSSGADVHIFVWNPETGAHIKLLQGHKKAVNGLSFQINSHQLFSCSSDRSIRIWQLDDMVCSETLFGHQDSVCDIDCAVRERPATIGGRDRTLRLWKIAESSQLVFNATSDSIECIKIIDDETLISGGDNGSVQLWNLRKKRPIFEARMAHKEQPSAEVAQSLGFKSSVSHPVDNSDSGQLPNGNSVLDDQPEMYPFLPCWVTSVGALKSSDVVASGSYDGAIRLWQVVDKRILQPLCIPVPCTGFVNALQFTSDCSHLIAAVGQEHRLGRWRRDSHAKNIIAIYSINLKTVAT